MLFAVLTLFAVEDITTIAGVVTGVGVPTGALIGWLVKSYFPSLIDKFQAQSTEDRRVYFAQIEKLQGEHRDQINELNAAHTASSSASRQEFLAQIENLGKNIGLLTVELREMKKSHS